MCKSAFCRVKIGLWYSVAVAALGLLLFSDGVALVVFGAIWDSNTSAGARKELYYLQEKKDGYTFDGGSVGNTVLMYEGLLVCIPVIPALLQLFKRMRFVSILFSLSLCLGLCGSVLAAYFSGVLWMNVQVVYQSYTNEFCKENGTMCSCKLPRGLADEKTASLTFSDCDNIATLHNVTIIYMALAIVASFLMLVGLFVSCTSCCGAEKEHDGEEFARLVNNEGLLYPTGYNNATRIHRGVLSMEARHAYVGQTTTSDVAAVPEPDGVDRAPILQQQQGAFTEDDQPLLTF